MHCGDEIRQFRGLWVSKQGLWIGGRWELPGMMNRDIKFQIADAPARNLRLHSDQEKESNVVAIAVS